MVLGVAKRKPAGRKRVRRASGQERVSPRCLMPGAKCTIAEVHLVCPSVLASTMLAGGRRTTASHVTDAK